MSAVTLMRSLIWKRKSLAGALGKAAAGQRELQTASPVCLSSASSWRGPDAGRAIEEVPAAPLEGSALFPVSLIAAGSGCCQVLHDSKSAPLLERRGDEAAAPYDDEGACEASGQVSAWYRLKLRSCGSCPGAPFQILKCHSMRSSAPASGHSSSLSCARTGSEAKW